MKNNIFLLSIMAMSMLCAYSMSSEMVYSVKQEESRLLLEKKLPQLRYHRDILPTLKINEIGDYYRKMPQECRTELMNRMSPELRLLHYIDIYLPQEIRKNIFRLMLGDDEKGKVIEQFCNTSILEAFQLSHTINKGLGNSNMPIALLYKKSKETREIVLTQLEGVNPWYKDYISPVVSIEQQKTIHELDEDIKPYFKGQEVAVVSRRFITKKKVCRYGIWVCCIDTFLIGIMLGGAALSGGIASVGNPFVLGTTCGTASVLPCCYATAYCWANAEELRDASKVTL